MNYTSYLNTLDQALRFAAEHTDSAGRMVVDGEIDTKDSGWLVLGGVIRGIEENWMLGNIDLKEMCRKWTMASVMVDDVKSAWTTFALLLCFEFTDGKFSDLFSPQEMQEISRFFRQIDMRFLLEASRNYRVAAAVIDILKVRYGFAEEHSVDHVECINYMLDGYLGEGFFNDDDGRGDNRDRRIDTYSAEIIGLLLHYDEIFKWQSFCHDRIIAILDDFCRETLALIDSDGEFAKWGRSLRGEAEVKKIFLWEFAHKNNMTDYGKSVSAKLFEFFRRTGFSADGKIGRDKAFDQGIWDEYTTHVQAQGYGIYGLAMALRFASDDGHTESLPSETQDYVVTLPNAGIICGNSCKTSSHYILPAANRLTKNMFFWHNRITKENDVCVDVSAKFMPIPYFGHNCPAPYSGSVVPFLPQIKFSDGKMLVPRNLDCRFSLADNTVCRRFDYCYPEQYEQVSELFFDSKIICSPSKIDFVFNFSEKTPKDAELQIHIFSGTNNSEVEFKTAPARVEEVTLSASIYGSSTQAKRFVFSEVSSIEYSVLL